MNENSSSSQGLQRQGAFRPRTFQTQESKNQRKKSSGTQTLCQILKITLDTGVLAFPKGFSKVYVGGGILGILQGLFLQFYSWNILIEALDQKAKNNSDEALNKSEQNESQNVQTLETDGNIEKKILGRDQAKTQFSLNKTIELELTTQRKTQFQDTSLNDNSQTEDSQIEQNNIQDNQNEQILPEKVLPNDSHLKQSFEYNHNVYDLIREEFSGIQFGLLFLQISTLLLVAGYGLSYCSFMKSTLESIDSRFQELWMKAIVIITEFIILLSFSFYSHIYRLRTIVLVGSQLSIVILYFILTLCLYQNKLNNQVDGNLGTQYMKEYPNTLDIEYGINWIAFPNFFGIALFCFDINGVITEIRQDMRRQENFTRILMGSMIIQCGVYIALGSLGYSAYGQYTADVITTNVSVTMRGISNIMDDIFLSIQFLYAVSNFISLIFYNVVGFRIITEIIVQQRITDYSNISLKMKFFIRIPFILTVLILAQYFESFSIVISLQGCVTSIILGFILPFILYEKVFKGRIGILRRIINILVVTIGTIYGSIGLVLAFVKY